MFGVAQRGTLSSKCDKLFLPIQALYDTTITLEHFVVCIPESLYYRGQNTLVVNVTLMIFNCKASCRTRKKYLKNSMSKNKMTFNF
jgi:hypothetical protein